MTLCFSAHESREIRIAPGVKPTNLLEGIAQQPGPGAEQALRRGARDPHHRVMVTALLALSRLGGAVSRETLRGLLEHPDPKLRKAAVWALDQLAAPMTPSTSAPHPAA